MIAPPAAAYLLTDSLPRMLALSVLLAVLSALGGFWAAWLADASIAGAMAAAAGAAFLLAFLLAPERGVVAQARRRARQRLEFARLMLVIHLLHHEADAAADEESREAHLHDHLRWTPAFARRIVRLAQQDDWVRREPEGRLRLTPEGRRMAERALAA
jgi:manganese/zinc/iron transport system permease protein